MATHSSLLTWRIPGMGEPGGLPSMGSHRVGHDWSDLAAASSSRIGVSHTQKSALLLLPPTSDDSKAAHHWLTSIAMLPGYHFQVASAALWLPGCSDYCLLTSIAVYPWHACLTQDQMRSSEINGLRVDIASLQGHFLMVMPNSKQSLVHLEESLSMTQKQNICWVWHLGHKRFCLCGILMSYTWQLSPSPCKTSLFVLQSLSWMTVCAWAYIGKRQCFWKIIPLEL